MAKSSTSTVGVTGAKPQMSAEEKAKLMEAAMAGFKKKYGDALVSGNKSAEELREAMLKVEVISTGSLSLDSALGVWGFPRGRCVELYGEEHSGKTSIALSAAGCCQRAGGNVLFIDVERALDPLFCMKNKCNYAQLHHIKPANGEDAMNQLLYWLQQNQQAGVPLMDMIIVDSVAALVTEGQIEDGVGKTEVAIAARLLSQTMRDITPYLDNAVVIFINQMRDKPGVMFGSHDTTPGGRALKYYSSVRCKVVKATPLFLTADGYCGFDDKTSKKGRECGRRVKVYIDKNKVAPKGVVAEFDFIEDRGIVRTREVANIGVEYGVISQAGAFYTLPDGSKAQGFVNLVDVFEKNPQMEFEVLTRVRTIVQQKRAAEVDKEIARMSSMPTIFDMWSDAVSHGKAVDLLDNNDAPPPVEDLQETTTATETTEQTVDAVTTPGLTPLRRNRK